MQGQLSVVRLLQERIEKRAYELYLRRGQQSGYEFEDWIEAERQILAEIRSPVYRKPEVLPEKGTRTRTKKLQSASQ
jgi:hypothetical protein